MNDASLLVIGFIIGMCVFHLPIRGWFVYQYKQSMERRRQRKEAEIKPTKKIVKRKLKK